VIYLDSSALLKLLFEEPETAALAAWISQRLPTPMASSEVVRVEVVRAARRLDPAVVPTARGLVAQLDLVPITRGLLEDAAEVGGALLRSLDAIHLSSAMALSPAVTAFVAYDARLASAAQDATLPVIQPGIS
jgi:predicted nucleic acid-binding protein